MTPLVAATSWAMEGLERQSCGMDRRAISVVAGARNHRRGIETRLSVPSTESWSGPALLVQIKGPQPLAGEQVAGLLLRDPGLNPCFSHGHVFTKCLRTCAVDAGSLKHAPPTF